MRRLQRELALSRPSIGRSDAPIALLFGTVLQEDAELRRLIERSGFEARPASSVAEARELDNQATRVVLVLGVDDVNACAVASFIRKLRGSGVGAPILMICRGLVSEAAAVALEAGASDFVQRSSVQAELRTRIQALSARQARCPSFHCIRVADLEIDRDSRSMRRGRTTVLLTNQEFCVLECLAQNAGNPVRREDLARHIGGGGRTNGRASNLVAVYIFYLRRKLSKLGYDAAVRTLRGVGYTMMVGVEQSSQQPRST